MFYSLSNKLSISENYNKFNRLDKSWANFFNNNLNKKFKSEKVYPRINKLLIGSNKYIDDLDKKISKFNPDIIFSSIDDKKIENLFFKFKKIKKVIWISYKSDKEKLLKLKKV